MIDTRTRLSHKLLLVFNSFFRYTLVILSYYHIMRMYTPCTRVISILLVTYTTYINIIFFRPSVYTKLYYNNILLHAVFFFFFFYDYNNNYIRIYTVRYILFVAAEMLQIIRQNVSSSGLYKIKITNNLTNNRQI